MKWRTVFIGWGAWSVALWVMTMDGRAGTFSLFRCVVGGCAGFVMGGIMVKAAKYDADKEAK